MNNAEMEALAEAITKTINDHLIEKLTPSEKPISITLTAKQARDLRYLCQRYLRNHYLKSQNYNFTLEITSQDAEILRHLLQQTEVKP